MSGLGRTGEGEITHVEGTIETAYVKDATTEGQSDQLVIELVDVVSYDRGSDQAATYGRGDRAGQMRNIYFVDGRNKTFRDTRDFFNRALEVEQIEDPTVLQGLRVLFEARARRNSDYADFVPTRIISNSPEVTEVAAMTEAEVREALTGATPAQGMALASKTGIRGTAWAAVVGNRTKVTKELGLELDANGRYQLAAAG